MAFQLVWIGDEQVDIVRVEGTKYPYRIPKLQADRCAIKSQYDIGYPPTPSVQESAATPETRSVAPVPAPRLARIQMFHHNRTENTRNLRYLGRVRWHKARIPTEWLPLVSRISRRILIFRGFDVKKTQMVVASPIAMRIRFGLAHL